MKANVAALAGIKRPRTGSSGGGGSSGGAASAAASAAASGDTPTTPASTRPSKRMRSGSLAKSSLLLLGEEEESTATTEGLLMSKALTTFPPAEQHRFESYRRCALPSDAISAYVSHRLLHNDERRYVRRQGTRSVVAANDVGVVPQSGLAELALLRCPYADGTTTTNTSTSGTWNDVDAGIGTAWSGKGGKKDTSNARTSRAAAPPLRDVVAPETSQEVTVVVSTLAKSYAQRLVSAARRVARARGYPDTMPLLPEHLVEAKQYRSEAGLDPGFFMGAGAGGSVPNSARTCGGDPGATAANAAALGLVNGNKLRLDAALEAQDEYDEQLSSTHNYREDKQMSTCM
mmetsp:Transcript_6503/g.14216  ORF Transcript_6503/g.14216 Transcript_6503/m.14216 type:complete len:346 (-) Transcript_6503:1662-2699(-)